LEDIDLIVSDIGLPDLDGRELIGRLRARRNVPAIALSGYGTEEAIQASLNAGFAAHVMKPTEMATLLEAIDNAVGRS
jgi:CheY-like chemotaxis protein